MTTSAHPDDADLTQVLTTRVRRHVGAIRLSLDGIALMLGTAPFYQVGDPDLMLHLVFLILAIQAFLGGLRPTLLRIGAGTIAVFGYSSFAAAGSSASRLTPLELTEWPVMVVIAVLVAVLAGRVSSVSAQYARLFRAASERLFTAQEDERRHVALELHDGVGQTLTALVLTLDAAESLMWSGPAAPPQHAREAMRRAQALAATALDETRDLSFLLRPSRITESGLGASLIELCRSAGSLVEPRIAEDVIRPGLLEPNDEIEAYRIVQEALGNALRHAHASRIIVEVTRESDHLRLAVIDNGIGIEPAGIRPIGLGVPGMHERASVIHGMISLQRTGGGGTTMLLVVPLSRVDPATDGASATTAMPA